MAKAAIFDLDGTLLDSVDLHAIAWHEAMMRFRHDVSFEQVRGQIGNTPHHGKLMDLLMLTVTGGVERSRGEFARIKSRFFDFTGLSDRDASKRGRGVPGLACDVRLINAFSKRDVCAAAAVV